ncbi:M56 family metallopeptidase [Carboxylicivirga marina]|uniref:M56 family metallopeptidase n=1 Tax=Carboxylicivirga marina TaxID=2800988 RepID=UPI002591AAE8|nr:M56 family metallopeptidase [uncultured Carboxylicivirga sp.]
MELLTYFSRSFLIVFLFVAIYHLFLRNDAHYSTNRFFLLLGLIMAIILPAVELNYTVIVEAIRQDDAFVPIKPEVVNAVAVDSEVASNINWYVVGMSIYGLVTLFFIFRLFHQLIQMLRLLRSSQVMYVDGVTVCVHQKVEMPFVFGNRIFINDEAYLTPEYAEVYSHERIHLVQHHWIDVILSELFIVFQWFNPFAWYYSRLVKQNLEFIADQGVLNEGFQKEKYIQHIICETMGAEASVLANHFRFSQNKRRLKMMKNNRKSKWRLLKLLLVLPLVGGLLWAFSEPVYEYSSVPEEISNGIVQEVKEHFIVKGRVMFAVGDTALIRNRQTDQYERKIVHKYMPGTSVVVKGTTRGCVTDMKGVFELEVANGEELVFSFVGFESKVVKVENRENIVVGLNTISYELNPTAYRKKFKGKITPSSPLKAKEKLPPPPPPPPKEDGKPVFYVVEDMPSYKGGMENYFAKLYTRIGQEKKKGNLSGTVRVQFVVDANGGVSKAKALNRRGEDEEKYAVKIVSGLKDWSPGKQRGKPVSTTLVVPVEFD